MNTEPALKKILIAPLDWGLGHATRCIPLIQYLQMLNCELTVAASETSLALLKAEFPNLNFLNLNAYNIIYSTNKRWMAYKVLIQIPKILKAINFEHKWLKKLLQIQNFDAIISDNRYGFYSKKTFSVFITHQLQINTNFKPAKNFLRRLTYSRINNFKECWVPDFEGNMNIAGALSHPEIFPVVPVKYIGPVSRFNKRTQQKFLYKYFIIISGPEPQRTLFEKKILAFVQSSKETSLIVLGKPQLINLVSENSNCKIYNHLSTEKMQEAFTISEFIVSRCGYTTVMDVLALKKKSILIPTPGQTEQEYLAKHLMQQKWSYVFFQEDDFNMHLNEAENFMYNLPDINSEFYKSYLKEFVSAL